MGILQGRRNQRGRSKMDHREVLKGIGIGLAVGSVVSMALSSGRRRRRKHKNQAMKAIGDATDKVTDMMGL